MKQIYVYSYTSIAIYYIISPRSLCDQSGSYRKEDFVATARYVYKFKIFFGCPFTAVRAMKIFC